MSEGMENKLLRLVYVALFYIIFSVTDILMLILAVLQSALNIFTGEPSDTLKRFGGSLAIYLKQITDYISHVSEQKPFPFSDWPESPADSSSSEVDAN